MSSQENGGQRKHSFQVPVINEQPPSRSNSDKILNEPPNQVLNACGSSSDDSGFDVARDGIKHVPIYAISDVRNLHVTSGASSSPPSAKTKKKSEIGPPIHHFSFSAYDSSSIANILRPRVRSLDLGYSRNRAPSLALGESCSTYGENDISDHENHRIVKKNLTFIFSCMYAIFVIVFGCVMYLTNHHFENGHVSEVFSSLIVTVGMMWLLFFHWDLHSYKKFVLSELKKEELQMDNDDVISTTTEALFNNWPLQNNDNHSYRFLRGRHSGSFYLKCGMAAFCFGHLINEGLFLGQQIMYFVNDNQSAECAKISSVVLHSLKPIYSFYQLYMVFKYSNIIINKHKAIANFGLMHLIATCVCFWFSTIVEDAFAHYQHEAPHNQSTEETFFESFIQKKTSPKLAGECATGSMLSSESFQAIPYLYPFTIEYNILLAGVWFIVWQNIGKHHSSARPHHFEHKVSVDERNMNEITYQSNLVISADCHSANRGLFAGLLLMMVTIVTVIIFFVAIHREPYSHIGVTIYNIQEITLTLLALILITIAYRRLILLDVNQHPITFLDDVLLFIPLPFYFTNSICSAMAEMQIENYFRVAIHILIVIQVMVQTPCIIEGLRRCSNSNAKSYAKPGRELVTFLIILNIAIWIVSTFELKSMEPYLGQKAYFGLALAVFIGHTTHPVMLFYRFHSSVCLADIWKSAYEKGE